MPLVKIKDFNALIGNKSPSKNQTRSVWKTYPNVKMLSVQQETHYISHHQTYYKVIGINLSRQSNTNISQRITFRGKWEEYKSATMFSIAKM